MKLKSSAFENEQPIPQKYTCQGEDVSPPLIIEGAPQGTESLVLIVDDPDAPNGTFDHWLAWNIPPSTANLPEGAQVPKQGKNHFGKNLYKGPCPPLGAPHHYHFKVYALDILLDLPDGSSKKQLEFAMKNHILAKGELIGTYQRK